MSSITTIITFVINLLKDSHELLAAIYYLVAIIEHFKLAEKVHTLLLSIEWTPLVKQLHNILMLIERYF